MTELIDLSGDVVLIVGLYPSKRFRISSAYLSKASSIFKTMFSGQFAEGQALSSFPPKEVPLPEDDAESMRILLKIVHHDNADVPLILDSATKLHRLAKLADKYDLVTATKFAFCCWFLQLRMAGGNPLADIDEVTKLASAAYLTRDRVAFRLYTKILARTHRWTVGSLLEGFDDEAIPSETLLRAILSLEQSRVEAFDVLESEMESFSAGLCGCIGQCAWSRDILLEIKSHLRETIGKDEFAGQKQVLFEDVLRQLNDSKLCGRIKANRHIVNHIGIFDVDMHKTLSCHVAAVEKAACRGLCLVCLQDGKGDPAKACYGHGSY